MIYATIILLMNLYMQESYINIQNLMVKIFHTIDGSLNYETDLFGDGTNGRALGGNLVPMAGEVHRHS